MSVCLDMLLSQTILIVEKESLKKMTNLKMQRGLWYSLTRREVCSLLLNSFEIIQATNLSLRYKK